MKILISFLIVLAASASFAASPTFNSFDTNQFNVDAAANTIAGNTNPANPKSLVSQTQVVNQIGIQVGPLGSNYTVLPNVYSIKAYGALGNGVADDTLAVSNTVWIAGTNGGGVVFVPAGTYKLTSTIFFTNNPVWLLGEGSSSIIAPSGNFDVFRFSGNTRGCTVSKLFLNGTNQTGGNFFTVTNSHRITFRDLTGETPYQVFSIQSCNTCTIDNVWMDQVKGAWFCKWFGDDANRSDILQFNNVVASGGTTNTDGVIWDGNCNSMDINNLGLVTMNYGIHILKTSGANSPAFLFSHGLQIDFPNREAVRIDAGQRYNFVNSYMHGSTLEYGVFATNGVSQVTIQGGNIDGHKKGGILLQSVNSKVIGVEITNNSTAGANLFPGILLTNGAIATIVGNRISGANQQYGVRSESATRPIVVGNDLAGNATGEFLDNGGTMISEFEMTQRPFYLDSNTFLSSRANNISTLVVTVNKLYMVPVWVTETRTFTTIALGEVSASATGTVRLGIYAANRITAHPTILVVDAGTISTGTTGTKTASISVTLNPGMYFLCAVFTGTPTVHALNSDCLGVGMNGGVTAVSGLSRTFTSAPFPGDESAQTYSAEFTFTPAIGIR